MYPLGNVIAQKGWSEDDPGSHSQERMLRRASVSSGLLHTPDLQHGPLSKTSHLRSQSWSPAWMSEEMVTVHPGSHLAHPGNHSTHHDSHSVHLDDHSAHPDGHPVHPDGHPVHPDGHSVHPDTCITPTDLHGHMILSYGKDIMNMVTNGSDVTSHLLDPTRPYNRTTNNLPISNQVLTFNPLVGSPDANLINSPDPNYTSDLFPTTVKSRALSSLTQQSAPSQHPGAQVGNNGGTEVSEPDAGMPCYNAFGSSQKMANDKSRWEKYTNVDVGKMDSQLEPRQPLQDAAPDRRGARWSRLQDIDSAPDLMPPMSRFAGSPDLMSPMSRFAGSPDLMSPMSRFAGSPDLMPPMSRFAGSPDLMPPMSRFAGSPDLMPPMSRFAGSPDLMPPMSRFAGSPDLMSPMSRFAGSPDLMPPMSRFAGSPDLMPPMSRFAGSPDLMSPMSRFAGSPDLMPPMSRFAGSLPVEHGSSEPQASSTPKSSQQDGRYSVQGYQETGKPRSRRIVTRESHQNNTGDTNSWICASMGASGNDVITSIPGAQRSTLSHSHHRRHTHDGHMSGQYVGVSVNAHSSSNASDGPHVSKVRS